MTSRILRSRLTACPVLELETRHALEFAHIVSDKSEPHGFGMSCDPEIVTADHLTASLERRANFTVGGCRFLRHGKHRQQRHKPRKRFQSSRVLLAPLCAIK